MIGPGGYMAAPKAEAQMQFESPLHEQLHWAEHHANDHTIAEHNRKAFAGQAQRLRDALNRPTAQGADGLAETSGDAK